jgi:hypothetical protein
MREREHSRERERESILVRESIQEREHSRERESIQERERERAFKRGRENIWERERGHSARQSTIESLWTRARQQSVHKQARQQKIVPQQNKRQSNTTFSLTNNLPSKLWWRQRERGIERKRMVGHHRHRICFSLGGKRNKMRFACWLLAALSSNLWYSTVSTVQYQLRAGQVGGLHRTRRPCVKLYCACESCCRVDINVARGYLPSGGALTLC